MEEEAGQIISKVLGKPESISALFARNFGLKNGVDLESFINENRQSHELMSFNDQQHSEALSMTERLINFCQKHEDDKSVSLQDIYGYLDALTALMELYEKKRFPIQRTTPSEMLAYLMNQHDLKQTDLGEELGGQSVVSEILRGKRELNIRQIRGLSERFNVSAAIFI